MARIDHPQGVVRHHSSVDPADHCRHDLDPAALAEVEEAFIGAGLHLSPDPDAWHQCRP